MWVYLLLAVLGAAFALAIVAAFIWALTRPSDRLQMATLCLFVIALLYLGVAWQLFGKGGAPAVGAVVLGVYGLALYAATAVLAIYYHRWAWKVAIGAFGLHIVAGVAIAAPAAASGALGLLGLAIWFILGGVGLWACVHAGSRSLIASSNAGHA